MDQNIETRHILRGISILDKAVEEYPEDWPAWEALGDLHQLLPEDKETLVTALSYYRQVIKHRPHREKSLSRAATILLKLRRANESEPMWRKLITINKWEPSYHQNLAIVCAGKGDWKGAAKHCADSLAVSPNDTIRRKYLIRCLLRSNQHKEAQLELQRVLRMDHEKADENTSWYGALQKSLRGSGDP